MMLSDWCCLHSTDSIGDSVSIHRRKALRCTLTPANQRFQWTKYRQFYIIETTALISTKFCKTTETTKWSSWVDSIQYASTKSEDDRFWWKLARWRILAPYRPLKFRTFKIQDGGGRNLEITKITISSQRLADLYEICTAVQNGSRNLSDL